MTDKVNKGGRPRKELTDAKFEQLKAMVQIQCTAAECCNILDMDDNTLDRRLKERGEGGFGDFFKKHGDEGKASLRRAQWKAAIAGQPTMLVWMGKQMLGQSDKATVENLNYEIRVKRIVGKDRGNA